MPISSQQVSGMIGGQQAMFGNFASYSQQISPGFQGQPPTYSNPMAGVGEGFAPAPMHNPATMAGPQALSAIGNIGLPALGSAALIGGMTLPGAMGRGIGRLDPFTSGLGGFSQGAGLRAGGMGIMSNMGRIASGGIGSIARAGIAGAGGAIAAAAPAYALGQAAQYGVSQAVQGGQFQNQVQGVLNQNFRFQNAQARTGYGFSREQGGDIASMVREMGHSDMMTGPQELLRVMKSGSQQGLFKAVQDVKEFKKRFTDMVGSLKEVAKTMNTTLEGAMPFFSQARQMGFWTPDDISRNAQQTRQTAATAGLSVAQTQQMMGQGAQMARSVGAMGITGAQGMASSLGLVGGALRGGTFSERELSEATGGLQGGQAVQSMAGTLQAATTRFASSRRARWMLASLGGKGFTSLDSGKMQDMMSGSMSLGDISRGARSNIQKQGKFNFVNNERELRGELIKQGPEAQLGFIRTMIGGRIYGDDAKSKTITRRLMKRYFGTNEKQSDLLTKMAREAPQIRRANVSRSVAAMDQQERSQDEIMNRSWEGIKRKMSSWWDKSIKDPIQQFGADVSQDIGDFFEKAGDKMWGRTPTRHRLRGIGGLGMAAMQRSAMGDTRIMEETFGKAGDYQKMLGASGSSLGAAGTLTGASGGIARSFRGDEGGLGNMFANATGSGVVSNDRMDAFIRMGAGEHAFETEGERDKAVRGNSNLMAGRYYGKGNQSYRAFDRKQIEGLRAGLSAGVTGKVSSQRQASALGFADVGSATTAIKGVQEELTSGAYRRQSMGMALDKNISGRDLGEAQVEAIMSGDEFPALKKYVGGVEGKANRVHRLAAAQTKEMRTGRGGVDLSEDAEAAGLGLWTGMEDIEGKLAEKIDAAEAGMGKAIDQADLARTKGEMGAFGWRKGRKAIEAAKDVGSPDTMAKLQEKGGDKYKKAMMLMATGDNEEDRKDNRERAQAMLTELAGDKDKFTDAEARTLLALGDDKHPNVKNIRKAAAGLGTLFKFKERAQFEKASMRHAKRLFRNMGDNKEAILGVLDTVKAEGGETSLGGLARKLETATSPEAYEKLMGQVVTLAGEADEGQIADAAELFKKMGGEGFAEALTGGRQIGRMGKQLTSKSKNERASGASQLFGGMLGRGKNLTPKQMEILKTGGAKAEELITTVSGDAPEGNQARVKELMGMLKGGGNITEITASARGQAASRAIATQGDKSIIESQTENIRGKIDILGQTGSPKGMHVELTRQTEILQKIMLATEEANKGIFSWTQSEKPAPG